ncbi:MAG: twin-arginine translocase TatA/TatE family subunit [Acidobacteriaceae bacterium]
MFEGLLRPMHLLVLLVIVLIIFGPSKLADLGKSLGEGIKNFKSSMKDDEKTIPPSPDEKK